MLILIDFYAENPIENKIIASSNRFRTIQNETGYDLVLTQTDPTKELKILGNDQPVRVQVVNNEVVEIKNSRNSVTLGYTNNTLRLFSQDYVNITGHQVFINSGTSQSQWKAGFIEMFSNYSSSLYPVLQVTSDVVNTDQRLKIIRKNDNSIHLETIASEFKIVGNSYDVNFVLTTGKLKLSNINNVQITGGSSGQVLTTDGTGNLSWTTPSSGGLTTSNFVFNEIPVGLINNVNLNYTLAFIPQTNTVQVFVNGLLQKPTTDYTISGLTLTFVTPLQTGDELLVHYIK